MRTRIVLMILAGLSLASGMAAADTVPGPDGDASRGEQLYNSRCIGCHSVDANRIGPMHRGVFGRKAGAVADFAYSAALKASPIVWDAETLDRWLADPQALVPGQKMNYRVTNALDRADLVAYLRTLR